MLILAFMNIAQAVHISELHVPVRFFILIEQLGLEM